MLRLIDANLNRLSEGLRVLEDVARFLLNDSELTEKLRGLRHEFVLDGFFSKGSLLASRDSERDIGREGEEGERRNIADLIIANAKRAQESLRVLEEFSKLPEIPPEIKRKDFKRARFALYEVEKNLLLKFSSQAKGKGISGLYVIIDAETLEGRSEVEVAKQAIAGGATIIQLRDKQRNKRELIPVAEELRQICAQAKKLFIINDYPDLALLVNADGVHLGQDDIPVSSARKLLSPDKIVGCSVRRMEQALEAQAEGADYIAVGSIYPSPTKVSAEVVGLETLRQIKEAVSVPVVAIGGINEDNLKEVVSSGADAVAVISAVLKTGDVKASAYRLSAKILELKAEGKK